MAQLLWMYNTFDTGLHAWSVCFVLVQLGYCVCLCHDGTAVVSQVVLLSCCLLCLCVVRVVALDTMCNVAGPDQDEVSLRLCAVRCPVRSCSAWPLGHCSTTACRHVLLKLVFLRSQAQACARVLCFPAMGYPPGTAVCKVACYG